MKQWHPIFAKLLRPVPEGYYEVLTNVAVGDVPREADIVLVRRASAKPLPFQGLWKDLTQWNVLEYKAPTVSPRVEHLDLLLELGLGIQRRLNEDRRKRRQQAIGPPNVSFWYLANTLGKRFLATASHWLKDLAECKEGVWCGLTMNRKVFLVSASNLAVEPDSLPLHVLGLESEEKELETARLIVSKPVLWELFGDLFANLHDGTFPEIEDMAKSKSTRKGLIFRPELLLRLYGKDEFNRGMERMLALMEAKERRAMLDQLINALPPAERDEIIRRLK
jgi:hypothetical protein